MKITSQLRKNLYLVRFTQQEIDELNEVITFSDEDIDIWAGENVLTKDTLWFICSEVNRLQHTTETVYYLREALKNLLYPSRQEESVC